MARPKKIKYPIWLIINRKLFGKSIKWLASKYNVSTRTVWRYLK